MPGAVLRVGGSKTAVQRFLATAKIKPHRVYLKGQPTSEGSTILARHSYFLVMASNAHGDDFDRQVRDASRFVKRHMKELRAMGRGRLHAVVDFGVFDTRTDEHPLLSWRLPVSLIQLLARAGVEAEVSFYES